LQIREDPLERAVFPTIGVTDQLVDVLDVNAIDLAAVSEPNQAGSVVAKGGVVRRRDAHQLLA